MNHKSPAKTLRDVVRMTRFLYRKNKFKHGLSIQKIKSVDVPPTPVTKPVLSAVLVQTTNVRPRPKPKLAVSRQISVDIPPDQTTSPSQKNTSEPFTMLNFMDILKKSELESRPENRSHEQKREKDLLEFKRSMGFPP